MKCQQENLQQCLSFPKEKRKEGVVPRGGEKEKETTVNGIGENERYHGGNDEENGLLVDMVAKGEEGKRREEDKLNKDHRAAATNSR